MGKTQKDVRWLGNTKGHVAALENMGRWHLWSRPFSDICLELDRNSCRLMAEGEVQIGVFIGRSPRAAAVQLRVRDDAVSGNSGLVEEAEITRRQERPGWRRGLSWRLQPAWL